MKKVKLLKRFLKHLESEKKFASKGNRNQIVKSFMKKEHKTKIEDEGIKEQ